MNGRRNNDEVTFYTDKTSDQRQDPKPGIPVTSADFDLSHDFLLNSGNDDIPENNPLTFNNLPFPNIPIAQSLSKLKLTDNVLITINGKTKERRLDTILKHQWICPTMGSMVLDKPTLKKGAVIRNNRLYLNDTELMSIGTIQRKTKKQTQQTSPINSELSTRDLTYQSSPHTNDKPDRILDIATLLFQTNSICISGIKSFSKKAYLARHYVFADTLTHCSGEEQRRAKVNLDTGEFTVDGRKILWVRASNYEKTYIGSGKDYSRSRNNGDIVTLATLAKYFYVDTKTKQPILNNEINESIFAKMIDGEWHVGHTKYQVFVAAYKPVLSNNQTQLPYQQREEINNVPSHHPPLTKPTSIYRNPGTEPYLLFSQSTVKPILKRTFSDNPDQEGLLAQEKNISNLEILEISRACY